MLRPLVALCALASFATCSGTPARERCESSEAVPRAASADVTTQPAALSAHYATDRMGASIRVSAPRAAGMTGKGTAIAIIDSGLDITHEEFRKQDRTTRVKWLLDYGLPISGRHPEIEQQFGIVDGEGPCVVKTPAVCFGAVFDANDVDALLRSGTIPSDLLDTFGHGTHITGIAAGSGVSGVYSGVAPDADLIIVRPRRPGDDGSSPQVPRLLRGVEFAFNRGSAMQMPVVVNLSLGISLGSPDQNDAVGQRFAALGGKPGQVIVASAGNDGFVGAGLRQTVHLTPGVRVRVPIDITPPSGLPSGSAYVATTGGPSARFEVGLEDDDSRILAPTTEGNHEADSEGATATLVWDPERRGANRSLLWLRGDFTRTRKMYITLEGTGTATLALVASPSALLRFSSGAREGTIASPGAFPQAISVGCTVNRTVYRSQAGQDTRLPDEPTLDVAGGLATANTSPVVEGAVCSFSGAGPGWDGSLKPEVVAPGFGIVSARSQATAGDPEASLFTNKACVLRGLPKECTIVAPNYGVASGTSMATPVVTGTVALLLQRDPTLTQARARIAIMSGVHPWRGPHPHREQSGTGEVDVELALQAVDRMQTFREVLPTADKSWAVASADYLRASGDRPLQVLLMLRGGTSTELADLRNVEELTADVVVNGTPVSPPPTVSRLGPGLFTYSYVAPASAAPGSVALGARFRGAAIVTPEKVSIATDWWTGRYPASATSACSIHSRGDEYFRSLALFACIVFAARRAKLRHRN